MSSFGESEMDRLFEQYSTVAAKVAETLTARNRILRVTEVEQFMDDPLLQAACNSLAVVGSMAFDAPIAMVTILSDRPTVDYLATCGAPKSDTDPCNESMCQYTVHFNNTLAVTDLSEHPEWGKGAVKYGLQSYIGSPWRRDGYPMGTFCVLDVDRREWTPEEIKMVETFAQQVTDLVEIGGS